MNSPVPREELTWAIQRAEGDRSFMGRAGKVLAQEITDLRAQLAAERERAEASYNHAEVSLARLHACQTAIEDFPSVVTELVTGFGIRVNETQIEAWLRDALMRKEQARDTLAHEVPGDARQGEIR